MIRTSLLIFPALLLGSALTSAQTFQPKTIQFKGDPEYTSEELSAAAGLKKGISLTAAEMGERTRSLMASGIFENITYTFNGQDLIFQIVPATVLYPLRFENLPLTPGKELDDKLHASLPLYHGKVPNDGTLLESVSKALEDQLAAKGITATIGAAPYTDMKLGKVTAIVFTVLSPPVRVGELQFDGMSPALAAKGRLAVAKLIGSTYSSDGSISQIETALGNYYGEQGYLDTTIHAAPAPTATVDTDGVHIPFQVAVVEGPQYKLASVQLAPDMVITQVAFDKQSGLKIGEVASLVKLRGSWEMLTHEYHNKGYMHAEVTATPTYDRQQASVTYAVSAQPGPVYTMGLFRIQNASDELKAVILDAWKIPQGAVFNEGALREFAAVHNSNPTLQRLFATVNAFYSLRLHDNVHTVDVDLSLERKH